MKDRVVGFAKEFYAQFQENDASGMAAELAYRWLFAIFPFGLFLAALGAFVAAWAGMENPAQQIVSGLGDNLPAGLASSITPEIERVIGQQQPGLASIGALAALWAATSGTMTIIKAMNRAYGVEETRPIVKRYALGIGLTIAGAIGLLAAFVTIVGGTLLTEQVAGTIGIGSQSWALVSLVRWPLVFVVLVAGVAVLLRVAPNMRPSWRWSLVAAAIFAVGWLVATLGFALYVSNFSNYGATYGALAGVIVLMLWFYLTALILVSAGELVAILTKRTEPERLHERQEETRAHTALKDAAKDAREKVGEAGRALGGATASAASEAKEDVDELAREARRPVVLTAPATLPRRRAPEPADGPLPAGVVALLAAGAAALVAALTTRIGRTR
jgi:membrane protein